MSLCKCCPGSPFSALLDPGHTPPAKPTKPKKRRPTGYFTPKDEAELHKTVRQWVAYAHPRARERFVTREKLEEVLMRLAKGINSGDDPILGPDDKCVFWHGDVTKDDGQAAMRMVRPGETAVSVTFTNRVFAFIFASDESYEQLMQLPLEPFKMSCGNQLCVQLDHISLDGVPESKASSDE